MENTESGASPTSGGQYTRVENIANLFGVTVRRIYQLTQEGILPTTETGSGRRYETIPTIQRYVKYLSDKAYGKNRSAKEMELREQKMEADIELKRSQGELHRLKTEIAAGKYISAEEVELDYKKFFLVFKRFALSIPSRMTDLLSGTVEPAEARRIENELQQEVRDLLVAFTVAGVTEIPEKGKRGKKE